MEAFDVLGDPVRRRILTLLAGDEYPSGDIVAVVQKDSGNRIRMHSQRGLHEGSGNKRVGVADVTDASSGIR